MCREGRGWVFTTSTGEIAAEVQRSDTLNRGYTAQPFYRGIVQMLEW